MMTQKQIWSQDKYNQAWLFAATAHQMQKIPGSYLPYITHVASVAMEVMVALSVETVSQPDLALQCALLHDVIEDTEITYQQVADTFGEAVAQGVLALTKNESLPDKPSQMKDSLNRIQEQPTEVWLVKLADRINNLATPPHYWTKDKIKKYWLEAQLIKEMLGTASLFLTIRLNKKMNDYRTFFDE